MRIHVNLFVLCTAANTLAQGAELWRQLGFKSNGKVPPYIRDVPLLPSCKCYSFLF
jgi:hypothetical protein